MKLNLIKNIVFGLITLAVFLGNGCSTEQPTPLPESFSFPPPNIEVQKPAKIETNSNITIQPFNNTAIEPKQNPSQPSNPPERSKPQEEQTDPHLVQTYITSTLQVNDTAYEVMVQWPSTAYDQLVKASVAGHISFHSINYGSLGNMVDEINGIKNSTSIKKYWIYYINGKKAQLGASQYFIQKGDVIRWHYEDEE